jgi:NO-binding membrane sensor protein with MHYT domain
VAEVRHFEFGLVSPALAVLSATFGCLLGIILTTKAQKVSGSSRVRLLSYATVAVGVAGVWQSNVLALMGLAVPGTVLRLNPVAIGGSLALAVVSVGTGLLLVSYGGVGFLRLLLAGGQIGLGVAGTHFLIVGSVRAGGYVTYEGSLLVGSVVLAMVAACALLWFLVSLRRLSSAIAAAVASGLAICGVHYLGQYAIVVHRGELPGKLPAPVNGVAPMTVMTPTLIFGGVLIAMLWFFTVGTATRRDLKAVFTPNEDSGQIEPWIIDSVLRRVATIAPGPAEAAGARLAPPARRSRIPSLAPVFRSVQVARTLDAHAIPQAPTPVAAMSPVPSVLAPMIDTPHWTDLMPELLPEQRAPLPERTKDRNTREHIDARSEDRNATLRRVSTVHRDRPPIAAAAPVSPAPGQPGRHLPGVSTRADVVPDADGRPRNRRPTP